MGLAKCLVGLAFAAAVAVEDLVVGNAVVVVAVAPKAVAYPIQLAAVDALLSFQAFPSRTVAVAIGNEVSGALLLL